jgi:hypothetical protein
LAFRLGVASAIRKVRLFASLPSRADGLQILLTRYREDKKTETNQSLPSSLLPLHESLFSEVDSHVSHDPSGGSCEVSGGVEAEVGNLKIAGEGGRTVT